MQVVLLERIARLGQMGDVVTVKDGYARNFLLPKGKALRANKENLAKFEQDKAQLEAQNLERKQEADAVKAKMDGHSVIVIRQSGDTGQLYGSVNSRDVADALKETGFNVDRSQVVLDTPIKTLGIYTLRIVLHPEVDGFVTVNVARTQEEAERQARGEDVTVSQDEDDTPSIEAQGVFDEGVVASLDDDTAAGDTEEDASETEE